MPELLNRAQLKYETRQMLRDAQVAPIPFTAVYLLLGLAVSTLASLGADLGVFSTFLTVLSSLISLVLGTGFALYCMAVRRGERAEYLTLFDGFSLAGKRIVLYIVMYFLVFLWSMLFLFPGIVAAYRYRFAPYNLYENPDLGVMEALKLSKQQTNGYKMQLFMLDLSYLGWEVLGLLPAFFFVFSAMDPQMLLNGQLVLDLTIPQALIADLWSIAVSLFYLPNQQCMDLAYFDAAKRTSGVYPQPQNSADNSWTY